MSRIANFDFQRAGLKLRTGIKSEPNMADPQHSGEKIEASASVPVEPNGKIKFATVTWRAQIITVLKRPDKPVKKGGTTR